MKKIFTLFAVVALGSLLWSCTKDKSDPPGPGPDPNANDGSAAKPYTIAEARQHQNSEVFWVKGYLVGAYHINDSTRFESPFYDNTNVLISDNANATSMDESFSVQLPLAQGEMRDSVGLVKNPGNKGRVIWFKGSGQQYCGIAGMKNTEAYSFTQPIEAAELSIADLRAMYTGSKTTIPANKKIRGIVISDKDNANTEGQNMILADTTNSAGVMIRFAAAHTFALNDKVTIDVSGMAVDMYSGALQVTSASGTAGVPVAKATKVGTGTVTPVVAAISTVNANFSTYESRLVRFENVVTFSTSGKYSAEGNNGYSYMADNANNSIVLYTRGTASFAGESLPTGTSHVVGYVTKFNSYIQVCMRSNTDVSSAGGAAFDAVVITSQPVVEVLGGRPYAYAVVTVANNANPTTVAATTKPGWLALSNDTLKGVAPATPAVDNVTITATNGAAVATQTFAVEVLDPANILAIWSFSSATDLNADMGSGTISKTATVNLSYTAASKTIYCAGWDVTAGKYWLMTIPVTVNVTGVVKVDFQAYGTATSPKNWKVQASADNSTWVDGSTYTSTASIAEYSLTVNMASHPVNAGGTLYVRLITTDLTAINGNPVASGGNSRLAEVSITK